MTNEDIVEACARALLELNVDLEMCSSGAEERKQSILESIQVVKNTQKKAIGKIHGSE